MDLDDEFNLVARLSDALDDFRERRKAADAKGGWGEEKDARDRAAREFCLAFIEMVEYAEQMRKRG